MSLVGTRPILQEELRQYELHHRARIAIKPGITGMWQVSGRSDITDFEEVVRLDTEYISKCWRMAYTRLIYLQTCDILGADAPYAALISHTPLRGEQQATILWSAKM